MRAVRDSGARVVLIGVFAPQEIWAYGHLDELRKPSICVGAAFDFTVGRKSRARRWTRRMGLKQAQRLNTAGGRSGGRH